METELYTPPASSEPAPPYAEGAEKSILSSFMGDPETFLGTAIEAPDPSIIAKMDAYFIGKVDQAKDGLQLVIAIIPSTGDTQHQIQLGRRRPHAPNTRHQRFSRRITSSTC